MLVKLATCSFKISLLSHLKQTGYRNAAVANLQRHCFPMSSSAISSNTHAPKHINIGATMMK